VSEGVCTRLCFLFRMCGANVARLVTRTFFVSLFIFFAFVSQLPDSGRTTAESSIRDGRDRSHGTAMVFPPFFLLLGSVSGCFPSVLAPSVLCFLRSCSFSARSRVVSSVFAPSVLCLGFLPPFLLI
jgi:hypothetical protein